MGKWVEEKMRSALHSSPYYALRRIHLEIQGETICLRGQVPSFHLKQMAQEVILESVPASARIDNQLKVPA